MSELAVPVMVALPEALPDLVVVTVTVALTPRVRPETVNGRLVPVGEPKITEPRVVVAEYE